MRVRLTVEERIALVLTLAALAFFFCWCVPKARGASWYVNPDATGAANGTNWDNGWPLITNIVWASVSAGDTIYLSGGTNGTTYNESLVPGKGGEPGNPITVSVSGDTGHSGRVNLNGQIKLEHSYLVIHGGKTGWQNVTNCYVNTLWTITNYIGLTAAYTNSETVLLQEGAGDGIVIRFLEVTNTALAQSSGKWPAIHDKGWPKGTNTFSHNYLHHNKFGGIGVSSGTNIFGATCVHRNIILWNEDDCIQGGAGLDASYNIVGRKLMQFSTGHPDTIQANGGFNRVWNNLCYWVNNSLICYSEIYLVDNSASEMYVYGNLGVANPETNYPSTYPLYRGSQKLGDVSLWVTNLVISNQVYVGNTIHSEADSSALMRLFFREPQSYPPAVDGTNVWWYFTNVYVLNNLLRIQTNASGQGGYAFRMQGAAVYNFWATNDVVVNYNSYSTEGGLNYLGYNDVDYATAAAFATATGYTNNNTTTPAFVSYGTNYALTADDTAALNKGVDLSAVIPENLLTNMPDWNIDLYGNARGYGGTWDIGALEYVPADTNLLLWLKFDDDLTDGVATDSSGYTNHALRFGRCGETTNWPVSVLVTNGTSTNTGLSATYYFDDYGLYGRSGDYMGITNLISGTGAVSQFSVMCWAKYGTAFDAGGDPGSWTYVHNSSLIDNGQYSKDGGWRLGRINAGDYFAQQNETVWMIYSNVGATNEATCQLSFEDEGDSNGATDAMRHYAVTFDRGTNSLYLNGVLLTNYVHPSITNLLLNTRTHWLGIAGWPHHGSTARDPWLTNSACAELDEYPNAYWFHGQMDDVRLYDRVLTAEEIATIAGITNTGVAPTITVQPQSRTNVAGTDALFTVTATGTAPLAYQWTLALEDIAGATSSSYTATNVQVMGEPASYQVVITNASGSVTSEVAYLTVTEPGEPEPDTNYYAAVSGLPKMKVGGQQVSMLVKADKFLPLVLAKSLAGLVSGITNAEQAGAARAMMHPLTRGLPLAVSSNVVYSNTWFLKNTRGVTAGSLGQWGSAMAAASNCEGNFHYCCGDTNGWGIYQVPCVLVNRRFTVSPGHTGKWNSTNCYEKWVGTNGVAYFVGSLASVDFDGIPCQNGSLPAHILQLALDLGYQTNVYPLLFDGKVTLLASDMPTDVESAVLWPTNLPDYTAQTDRAWMLPAVQTGQFAQWCVVPGQLTVGWIPYARLEVEYHEELDQFHVPLGTGGSSGSPGYEILNDQAVLTYGYANTQHKLLFEAAMLYLWTNNGMSADTCPGFREVDLSAYARLR